MKKIFSVVFVALLFTACKKDEVVDNSSLPEQTLDNVSYGTDTAQRMDVYLPAGRTATETKAIILIHGGAWISGNKVDMNPYIPLIKSRMPDYVIFNIGYRLAIVGGALVNPFPTQENDAKAAVSFIVSKANEYKFSPDKMVILGASAGGHMAMLQAYKNATPKFKAVADYFGPTDMSALYASYAGSPQLFGFQFLMGGTPATNAALYASSSPINFVSAQSPPTIILHGTADAIVPYSQSTTLKTKLESVGVATKLVTYNGLGHGDWSPSTFADSYDQTINFLKEKNP